MRRDQVPRARASDRKVKEDEIKAFVVGAPWRFLLASPQVSNRTNAPPEQGSRFFPCYIIGRRCSLVTSTRDEVREVSTFRAPKRRKRPPTSTALLNDKLRTQARTPPGIDFPINALF